MERSELSCAMRRCPDWGMYETLFLHSKHLMVLTDGYRIIEANRAFLAFFEAGGVDVFDPGFDLSRAIKAVDKYGYIYEGYLQRSWVEHVFAAQKEDLRVAFDGPHGLSTFLVQLQHTTASETIYLATFTDVTEMMSYKGVLEEGLRTTLDEKRAAQYILRQYDAAIDVANLVSRSDLHGVITYANEALCAALHYAREELVGQHIGILFEDPSEAVCETLAWDGVLEGKAWKGVLRHIDKHRRVHYFATTIVPILDPQGSITEILSIRHEITEMVRAKEEAIETLEAKSKFFDQVSHELRTPLNAIVNFTDQALELLDEELDDEVRELLGIYLRRSFKNAEQLLALINSLLDVAKMKAGKTHYTMHEHNAVALVQDAFESCASLGRHVRFTCKAEVEAATIRCDAAKLRQVLINLISNALKFTREGFVEIRVGVRGTLCRIEVEDSGIGIPAHKIAVIFEPFEQVRDHGFGTGLGLNIVREYLQMMGMRIEVRSSEGEGSCFSITAPLINGI